MAERATFHTIANARYFQGLVALLNSLRLTGHDQELKVLDLGLTPQQRERLADHVTLVQLPDELGHPVFMKPYAHRLSPTGTVVIIDCDMIVTASLDEPLADAAAGKIAVFSDHESTRDRWFAEWETEFQLSGPPRRQEYVNAGFVAVSQEHWPGFLSRWAAACELLQADRYAVLPPFLPRRAAMDREPSWAGDQDALNAILMAELTQESLAIRPHTQQPDWLDEVEVVDERTLACRYRGDPTLILHLSLAPKPWEPTGWRRTKRNAYVRLLSRVLLAEDVAVRLDPAELPLWLRDTRQGRLTLAALDGRRRTLDALERVLRGGSQRLPATVRKPLLGLRDRLSQRG